MVGADGRSALPPAPHSATARAQVFVDDLEALDDNGALALDADEARHLARVLRLRDGELVRASDGAGRWRPCAFRPVRSAVSHLEPLAEPIEEPAPSVGVTIGFASLGSDANAAVVAKLTELGVDRIVLLATERVVSSARLEPARVQRLRRVARAAAMQCRRVWLPAVEGPVGLADFLDSGVRAAPAGADLAGVASGGAAPTGAPPAGVALADPGGEPPDLAVPAIAVGPEGGWSAREREAATRIVGLGTEVLRAETAAVVAGALLTALRAGLVLPVVPPRPAGFPGRAGFPGPAGSPRPPEPERGAHSAGSRSGEPGPGGRV